MGVSVPSLRRKSTDSLIVCSTVIPTSFSEVVLLLFHWLACARACDPHPFAAHGHVKPHVHYNDEMAFGYTEVLLVFNFLELLVQKGSMKILYGTVHGNKKLFHIQMKVYNWASGSEPT